MSGMYDQPPSSDLPPSGMKAYPNVERGVPVGRAVDAVGFHNAGEQRSREMQVEIETIKLLRQDVVSCYRREGVNHYANCRKEVDKYVTAISDPDLLNPKQRQAKLAKAEGGE
ncbi:hypothetical protein TrVE_jg4834 [Triparma verrucosa]|uniref:NADH-ubiquinone oxidoreductase 12 kDa subunit n=2 Tax=Triparma TaxID=722752 RepID=A0A9W7EKD8_9STRA|nr:hypothetical protein TrST_g12534 [Triparma strigata]GMH96182.1 hypothetical protein TrVE_jg4834 [Triparma verrucosa]|eukprot:CAMPEP_0182490494 /NCGR_PEP_ID=MMETSP1321-20130603/335_1 /TAXON_ID=91990 /ORGANISM="Bolidomonas sp., Strain RCC1657" /LENGTH=112 /DNA_ID=CAMNT_0024692683 /DNA_START=88 /DNA_END=426 /DNA_ORIENTATION=+